MSERIRIESEPNNDRTEFIYQAALREHPAFAARSKEKMEYVIQRELQRIDAFETKGKQDEEDNLVISKAAAEKIDTIWVFSGPGTYDTPLKEMDKFEQYPWARWMDRRRTQHGFLLAQRIAEMRSGKKLFSVLEPERVRDLINEYGPYVVYNGTTKENDTLAAAVHRSESLMPAEKTKIIYNDPNALKHYTANQLRNFGMPDSREAREKDVALISHAPHLNRILHMMERYKPLPEGEKPYVFPLSSGEGREQFTELEVKGLLYYMYLSPNREAAENIYPYVMDDPTAEGAK